MGDYRPAIRERDAAERRRGFQAAGVSRVEKYVFSV
jgi:hypothetical protein